MGETFKNQLPSECSQLRYTGDILEYLFKSTAERVPSKGRSDIPAIYFFGFPKLSAVMLVVQRSIVKLLGYYFEV